MPSLSEVRKVLAAVAGIAAILVAQGVLHGTVQNVVETALAVLTAAGVYQVPNADPPAVP